MSEQRYELVGLTLDQLEAAVEAVGGTCIWSLNHHCYPTGRAIARPMGCQCQYCSSMPQRGPDSTVDASEKQK